MEEFKKKGYYPAGGRSSSTSAANITYNNSDSGIDATNVQQAIDAVAQGGGGGESNVTVINTYVEDVVSTTDISFSQVIADIKAGKYVVLLLNYANQYVYQIPAVLNGDLTLENPTPTDVIIGFDASELGAVGKYTDEYTVTWEA